MGEMSNLGPALEDLDAILDSMKNADADIEQLEMMVNNDSSLFISAVDGIEDIWNERVASASELKDVTDQEKNEIYQSLKDEMISDYISENMDDLQAAYYAEAGLGGVQELTGEIVPFFEEVYNTDHEVVSSSGDYVTTLKSEVTYVDAAFEDVGNGNQPVISVKGTITDDDGNFAGEFERYLYKQDGVWMVDHHIFKMDDDYRGLGFGKEFIQRQEDWYAQRGIGAITVMTGWDGARHWARSGFDWNPKNVESGIRNLYYEANNSTDFLFGSPARAEFDALMERATNGYKSTEGGIFYDSVKSVSDNNFPLPNDFAMIGYSGRQSNNYESPVTGETKTEYSWVGQRLLQDQNLYYTKVLTAEGRNLFEGPIDRDGDGLVFDGTAREKPASAVNS
jgi:GNAT superfamily N-acetyltransferase